MDDTDDEDLFEAVTSVYELAPAELVLLAEAQKTADLCVDLQTVLDDAGLMVTGPQGVKVHPAAVELRQQRLTLARLLVALRIPTDDEGEPTGEGRTQRRGLRGVYGFGESA